VVKTVNVGYKQTLLWGCETTYGAAATIDEPVGLVQSVNPTENNDTIKVRTMGGTRDYSNIVPGKFSVSGSFDYYLQVGPLLRQAFGEDSAGGTVDGGSRVHTGSSYKHVLGSATSVGADAFPCFSLELSDYEDTGAIGTANLKRTYTGCRVNSLSISASVDEPVKCSVDWVSQGVTIGTGAPTSVSQSTKDPFVFYQGAVYATSGAVSAYTSLVNASTSEIAEVNSINFAINNNLESVWYVSGTTATTQTLRGLKALLAKGRDYTASLGLHFKNKKMYQRFLGSNTSTVGGGNLSKYTVVVDFCRSGYPGSTPKLATDDYMRLVLGSCAFNSINITGSPEDIVSQDIDIMVPKAKLYYIDTDQSWA